MSHQMIFKAMRVRMRRPATDGSSQQAYHYGTMSRLGDHEAYKWASVYINSTVATLPVLQHARELQ